MNRTIALLLFILFSLSFYSCASTGKVSEERVGLFHTVTDISEGLPTEGLWRENIALIDMDGDGFHDIVAPPPRKADEGQQRPFIFLWNEKERKWIEANYTFPDISGYNYGGIAVGDINNDGYADIVLASHAKEIIILLNDRGKGFIESAFTLKEEFHSRTVELSDINGDGWLDILALSEAQFIQDYKPKGILKGLNKEGMDWDWNIIEDSLDLFGDSMSLVDINGDGKEDMAVAVLTTIKEHRKFIWFGDGNGNFKSYKDNFIVDDNYPFIVRTGNVDSDELNEVVFGLSGYGRRSTEITISVFKWTGDGFSDISLGLDFKEPPIVFELADLDGDDTNELVVLTESGMHIFKYNTKWLELGHFPIPSKDTLGAEDLRIGRNKDGSIFIVYNMGKEAEILNHGIKAYMKLPQESIIPNEN